MTKPNNISFQVRPTAYRAWDGKKMVQVQTLCWNAGGMIWYGPSNAFGWAWINPEFKGWDENNPKPSERDICPVMQWTGLRDKAGKDIWEGDIIRYYDNYLGRHNNDVVVFELDSNQMGYVGFAARNNGYGWDGEDRIFMNESEVIGNIFETPELLEQT